jgi:phage FluMu gp28-like protein
VDIRSEKAAFAVEFIDLPEAAQMDGAQWEAFQIQFLNNEGRFGLDKKSRQVGWSFTAAVDAVVDGILNPDTPHIFVSINQDEAKEKIRYVRQVIGALDPPVRPVVVRDSQTEIECADGTRFISHPCRPPRGKAGARIYLDEAAHYPDGMDREIYQGGLPATTKGHGYIRLGSSTLGARGLFWEIDAEQLRRYPGYDGARQTIPWWEVRALCRDVVMAWSQAPLLPTEERVYRFGTAALIEIFENMFLEDFQQEYECAYVDEASAWIDWDLIARNQQAFLAADMIYWHARSVEAALALIPLVQQAIEDRRVEPVLAGGIDVGRKRNATELIVVGKSTTGQMPTRLIVTLDRVKFDDQQRCFAEIVRQLPFTTVLIDQNGIGMQLSENLADITHKVQPAEFTNPSKELWAVEARLQAERVNVPLPPDRDLAYQIHSIKKKVTASKHNVFDAEANEKHHADKFWAWALAVYAASSPAKPAARQVTAVGLYGARDKYRQERRRRRHGR